MPKKHTKTIKQAPAPAIRWSGLVEIQDIVPKRSRYGSIYAVLYTSAGLGVCASEQQAQKMSLYEPYQLTGFIKTFMGGQYLKLGKAELFHAAEYRHVLL